MYSNLNQSQVGRKEKVDQPRIKETTITIGLTKAKKMGQTWADIISLSVANPTRIRHLYLPQVYLRPCWWIRSRFLLLPSSACMVAPCFVVVTTGVIVLSSNSLSFQMKFSQAKRF